MALQIRLFGRLQVLAEGAALTARLRPRAQRLLAYLLLQRAAPLPRDALAYTLWPDQTEAGALGTLRRALSDLRAGLPSGEWVTAGAGELQWNTAAPAWLDVEVFERLLRGGGPASLHDAAGLYGGDLLADWSEDWVPAERERLRQMQLGALRQLVAHHRGLRDHRQALVWVKRWVALDPLAEAPRRDLMALWYESGDRAAALAEYERWRTLLRAELGVAPMPETEALARAMSQGQPLPAETVAQPASAPAGAGPRAGRLLGRDDEAARLAALWASTAAGQGRLVLVAGEAGVGKSRLAAHTASQAIARGGSSSWGTATSLSAHCPTRRSPKYCAPRAAAGRRRSAARQPRRPGPAGAGSVRPRPGPAGGRPPRAR